MAIPSTFAQLKGRIWIRPAVKVERRERQGHDTQANWMADYRIQTTEYWKKGVRQLSSMFVLWLLGVVHIYALPGRWMFAHPAWVHMYVLISCLAQSFVRCRCKNKMLLPPLPMQLRCIHIHETNSNVHPALNCYWRWRWRSSWNELGMAGCVAYSLKLYNHQTWTIRVPIAKCVISINTNTHIRQAFIVH